MLGISPKLSILTGMYYAHLLDQLRTANHENAMVKLSKGGSLQQDNARFHTCKVAKDAVEQNGYYFFARYIAVVSNVCICLVCDSSVVATCPSIQAARFAFRWGFIRFVFVVCRCFVW